MSLKITCFVSSCVSKDHGTDLHIHKILGSFLMDSFEALVRVWQMEGKCSIDFFIFQIPSATRSTY